MDKKTKTVSGSNVVGLTPGMEWLDGGLHLTLTMH